MEDKTFTVASKLVDFECKVPGESRDSTTQNNDHCVLTLKVDSNQGPEKQKTYEISIDKAMLGLMTHSFEKLRDQLSHIASKS